MPIDLPNISGKVPHDVEQAILRLREGLETAMSQAAAAADAAANMPAPLTLPQIQQALSATGSHPVQTAALLGTNDPPATPPSPPTVPPGQTYPDDYADVCSDSTLVVCASPQSNSAPTVTFGGDAPITIPSSGKFLWAEKVGAAYYAIVQGNDGNAYLVTRGSSTVTTVSVAYGNNSVGLRTDGTTVVQNSPSTYLVGGVSTPIPAPYVGTQNGFLMLDSGGNPVWTDAQIATPVVINDVTFAVASTDGNWTVGRSTITGQFIAYNSGTNLMYVVGATLGSPVAPRITQITDGSAIVARSLPAAFFGSAFFTPYNINATVPPSALDLNTVIWAKGVNAKDWTPTSTITSATHVGTTLCINHTKAGLWPTVPFFDSPDPVEGNQWLFAFISGQWYAGAAEWLRPGQVCKDYAGDIGHDAFGGTPMENWNPVPGETVGVMVSCPARAGQWTLAERSNVVMITW